MIFKTRIPSVPLDRYVRQFTYYEGYDPVHSIETLLPDGTMNVIIELDAIKRYTFDPQSLERRSKCTRAWVSGMQRQLITFSAAKHSRMFIIQFHPGGGYPFIGLPTSELNDQVVDAELIFGRDILSLRDQLYHSLSFNSMVQVIENWLKKRARHQSLPEAVVQYSVQVITREPTLESIQYVARKSGYSQKQFIHLFKKHIGLTPKYFQRIVRFNRTLQEIEHQRKIDWVQISFDCGYYDQAHFINEFKHFSGRNPTRYLVEKGEYLNYIPIYREGK